MSNRRTTYYERVIRESVDAGGASTRCGAGRGRERGNVNELEFDFDLFSLVHEKDLEAHQDGRDCSYEREGRGDAPPGVAIPPMLRVVAVMTREPLVALNYVLLP